MLLPWLRSFAQLLQAIHVPALLSRNISLRSVLPLLIVLAQFSISAVPSQAFDVCYWVWHRTSVLTPKEEAELAAQGTTRLLWHVGTLRGNNGEWVSTTPLLLLPKVPGSLVIIPVFRIIPEHQTALSKPAAAALANRLLPWLHNQRCTEVQIDFDCPDRRLGEYVGFLQELGAKLRPCRLSATALAGWTRLPAFGALQDAVDALYPMFYDLQPDTPDSIRRGEAEPLLAYTDIADDLERWRACQKPWYAGLPNFARVTLFDARGDSRGHLRSWDWDDICFSPHLRLQDATKPGLTSFRVTALATIADTELAPHQLLATRVPARADLLRCVQLAETLGAKGVCFFRLPGVGPSRGWSLQQLGSLLRDRKTGAPSLLLKRNGQRLELLNNSSTDLAPRLSGPGGPQDRGYQLELESQQGSVFRDASPGEFARVFGHQNADSPEPKPVPVPIAERLTFWFADLPAGRSRETGIVLLSPAADIRLLRWRIINANANFEWQSLE